MEDAVTSTPRTRAADALRVDPASRHCNLERCGPLRIARNYWKVHADLLRESMLAEADDVRTFKPQFTTIPIAKYLAHRITLAGVSEDAFAKSLSTARVDMNPHQVDAALFALGLATVKGRDPRDDEVGLGKTIEASLVIAQRWAERKRRVLLIVPASLRKQWTQELWDKFALPSPDSGRKVVS